MSAPKFVGKLLSVFGQPAVSAEANVLKNELHIHIGEGTFGDGVRKKLSIRWDISPVSEDPLFHLLTWQAHLTDLIGKDHRDKRDDLVKWALDPTRKRLRFVTGPGGTGKTRLGAEVGDVLQQKGFAAGRVVLDGNEDYVGNTKGTLLIVDYPEEKTSEIIKTFFSELQHILEEYNVKVLFLTRRSIQDWKNDLYAWGVQPLLDHPTVHLSDLPELDSLALFSGALTEACHRSENPLPQISDSEIESWFNTYPEFKRPLFTTAAAVCQALYPEKRVVGCRLDEVVDELILRERRRLLRADQDENLELLYALAAISGDLPVGSITKWVNAGVDWLSYQTMHDAVIKLNNSKFLVNDCIPAPVPDLLAAAFLWAILNDRKTKQNQPTPAMILIALLSAENAYQGFQHFARLAYDAGSVYGAEPAVTLGNWLAEAVKGNVDICVSIEPLLAEEKPQTLVPVSIVVNETLLQKGDYDETEEARLLSNLSNDLSYVGEHHRALDVAQRSVEIREKLVAADHDRFEPDLALSLNNLSGEHFALGQFEAARDAALKAVTIREKWTAKDPESYEPALAKSLSNLSIFQAALGQFEAARDAAQRAERIISNWAIRNPDHYEPALAATLIGLSNRHAALNDHEAARDTAQRAVAIHAKWAAKVPDRFEPDLAKSLSNLCNRQSKLGDHDAARDAVQRSVEIYERWAAKVPDRFEPELAKGLNNLSNQHAALGDHEAAQDAAIRAIEIKEKWATKLPDAFIPSLASSKGALGRIYISMNQVERAAQTSAEGANLVVPYATRNPRGEPGQWFIMLVQDCIRACQQLEKPELIEELLSVDAKKLFIAFIEAAKKAQGQGETDEPSSE